MAYQYVSVLLHYNLPEKIAVIGKGVCPLSMLNIYWIQLVALQSFASFPHSRDRAFTLLDGAWTSLQALYMAEKEQKPPKKPLLPLVTHRAAQLTQLIITHWMLLTISKGLSNIVLHFYYVGSTQLGSVHELTLVGAACELTEEVHQVEEAGRTPVHRCKFQMMNEMPSHELQILSILLII